jgi:hypothetical protein
MVALGIASANKPVAARTRWRTPTSAAHAPAAQELTVDQLRAGACLQGPPDINTTTVRPDVVTVVPCVDEHLAEAYFVSANYWPETMAFPGNATIIHQADAECRKAFRAYDGIPWSQSQYGYSYWYPLGAADWDSGDRLLFCTAYYWSSSFPRGELLYGSIKNSDR